MSSERGIALLVTMMAMLLLSAIAGALVLATSADTAIAANAGALNEAFYAAEAALERTVAELRMVDDFTSVLSGSTTSRFTDGPSSGVRGVADGGRIDLDEIVNLANCQKRTGCSESDLNATTRDRPWGSRNPRWRLFSYGPLLADASGIPSAIPVYVVSLVADDPADTDGDPWRDGVRTGAEPNPGAGRLLIRSEAFGRRGANRVIEAKVFRRDIAALAVWDAADPATRGSPPPTMHVIQLEAWREL